MKRHTTLFVICCPILLGGALLASQNTAENSIEIRLMSFSSQTLVPITTETIWESACAPKLTAPELRSLDKIIDSFVTADMREFNEGAVRFAMRRKGESKYLDVSYVQLQSKAPKQFSKPAFSNRNATAVFFSSVHKKYCPDSL